MMKNGFSLVEMLIAITIMSILASITLPAYKGMMASARVRTTAELFNQGLQLARAEAIKHNDRVYFSFSTTGWTVGCVTTNADCQATIQEKPASEGSKNVALHVTPADASKVTFTSLGRLYVDSNGNLNNPDGSAEFQQLDFSATATNRRFTILIRPAGQVKMCSPNATSGSPTAC